VNGTNECTITTPPRESGAGNSPPHLLSCQSHLLATHCRRQHALTYRELTWPLLTEMLLWSRRIGRLRLLTPITTYVQTCKPRLTLHKFAGVEDRSQIGSGSTRKVSRVILLKAAHQSRQFIEEVAIVKKLLSEGSFCRAVRVLHVLSSILSVFM